MLFAHRHLFLFGPRVFSRALGSGARRQLAQTPRRKCGPWPRSVARALGINGRENWRVTTGGHSERLEPSRPMQTHVQVKKISDGLRMSFRILQTARTDCLPTSCSCSSAPRAHAPVLVLVLSCSWSCSSALVLVLECSRARACSCLLCRKIQTSQVFIFRLFAFGSVCCCKIVRQGQFFKPQVLLCFVQALLGHSSNCSSSTSASTSKSADPQQQHQQLECVACSNPCSMFPPAQPVTM